MAKEVDSLQDAVAETLYIPLKMRATISQTNPDLLKDRTAERLVEEIDYDFSKFEHAKFSLIGCAVRARFFDDETYRAVVKTLDKEEGELVVISIGCGLDDRRARVYERLSTEDRKVVDKWVSFYEVDLGEVIELREKLLPPATSQRLIPGVIQDLSWFDIVRKEVTERRQKRHVAEESPSMLILIEGVLMYFEEETIKTFFHSLGKALSTLDNIASVELVFDVVNSFSVKQTDKHDAIRKTDASMKWPCDDNYQVQTWDSRFKFEEANYIMKLQSQAWPWYARLVSKLRPFRESSRILKYRFDV